jgi:hypothetical protein
MIFFGKPVSTFPDHGQDEPQINGLLTAFLANPATAGTSLPLALS